MSAHEEDVRHFDSVDPLEESQVSLVSSSTSSYSSFPVDVVVYVRVQVLHKMTFDIKQKYKILIFLNVCV